MQLKSGRRSTRRSQVDRGRSSQVRCIRRVHRDEMYRDKKKPHSHGGYYHAEYLGGLSSKERAMVDRVFQLWNNEKNKG